MHRPYSSLSYVSLASEAWPAPGGSLKCLPSPPLSLQCLQFNTPFRQNHPQLAVFRSVLPVAASHLAEHVVPAFYRVANAPVRQRTEPRHPIQQSFCPSTVCSLYRFACESQLSTYTCGNPTVIAICCPRLLTLSCGSLHVLNPTFFSSSRRCKH